MLSWVAAARVTGVDLEERLVRLPRTGEFGWLRDSGDPRRADAAGEPPTRTWHRAAAPCFP